VILTRDN